MHDETTTSPASISPTSSHSSNTPSLASQRFPFLSETSHKPILTWKLHTFTTRQTTPADLLRDLDAAALGQASPISSTSRTSSGFNPSSPESSFNSGSGSSSQTSSFFSNSSSDGKPRRLRCARIKIPRGASRVEIKQRDLYEEPERSRYKGYPNQENCVASVGLPRGVWVRNLLFGSFGELYVISPEGRSEGSEMSSES